MNVWTEMLPADKRRVHYPPCDAQGAKTLCGEQDYTISGSNQRDPRWKTGTTKAAVDCRACKEIFAHVLKIAKEKA